MRLKAEQLGSSLKHSGLAPIYYISGDEPLQLLEAEDEVRRYARNQGFEERIVMSVSKDFDWNQLKDTSANLSLFSSKRLIELRLGDVKVGTEGSPALVEYAGQPPADHVLVITSAKIDSQSQKSRWFKALDQAGIMIQVWDVNPDELPNWVQQRLLREGKQISPDAARLIAERVEGNLLAARQELDKLCLLVEKTNIELDDVLAVVADSTHYNVFILVEDVFSGHIVRTMRMLNGLQKEGAVPLAIFGALMWEFRRACSMAYQTGTGMPREKVLAGYHLRPERNKAINRLLDRYSTGRLQMLLTSAMRVDRILKGAQKGNSWDELAWFLLRIAGADIQKNLSLM